MSAAAHEEVLYVSLGGRKWLAEDFSEDEADFLRRQLSWAFGEPRPRSDTFHNGWREAARCSLPPTSWSTVQAPVVRVCRNAFFRLAQDEGRFAPAGIREALFNRMEDLYGDAASFAGATGRHKGRLGRVLAGVTPATTLELDAIARDLGFRIVLEPLGDETARP